MDVQYLGKQGVLMANRNVKLLLDPREQPSKASDKVNADVVFGRWIPQETAAAVIKNDDARFFLSPGEYELGGVFVRSLAWWVEAGEEAPDIQQWVYLIDLDELKMAYLVVLSEALDEERLEEIGPVDVLILDLDGMAELSPKALKEVVKSLAPKRVVPVSPTLSAEALATAWKDVVEGTPLANTESTDKLSLKAPLRDELTVYLNR